MKKQLGLLILLSLVIGMIASFSSAQTSADFREVEQALGAPGQIQEGAWVVPFPRSDIRTRIYLKGQITFMMVAILPVAAGLNDS